MRTARPVIVYALMGVVGIAAFLYPFWIPQDALPANAHAGTAPLIAAAVAVLALVAVGLELRRGTMNGATIAVLGVLSAIAGLLRLLDLPGGGSGIFFLVVLAAAAYGPRFGMLLGLGAMVVSSIITGGIGPWLPFQMLALSWMGAGAGFLGLLSRRWPIAIEVTALAVYGWVWGFAYGAIMNLWFWPFQQDGGALSWDPALDAAGTLERYRAFYMATSFPWDAAGALTNAVLIAITGATLLASLRRIGVRLRPVVVMADAQPESTTEPQPSR